MVAPIVAAAYVVIAFLLRVLLHVLKNSSIRQQK